MAQKRNFDYRKEARIVVVAVVAEFRTLCIELIRSLAPKVLRFAPRTHRAAPRNLIRIQP